MTEISASNQPRRVIFMGSDAIALPLVDWLYQAGGSMGFMLTAVYSQPDRPHGRGQKLQPNPVAAWAREKGLTLHQPEKPDESTLEELRQDGCDLVLVMAYGHILRRSLLEVPSLGFVNFHASLLPRYRGASPVETAVACGEKETGVSLMRIVPRMDAGPVCDRQKVVIEPEDTAGELRERLALACVPLMERNMPALLAGRAVFHEQDDALATYCRKLEKQDGCLDFSAPAEILAARINGLDPWPGAYCEREGIRLKLRRALAEDMATDLAPGTVLPVRDGRVGIATGKGVLRVGEWQRPGGRMLPAMAFLSGFPMPPGTCLESGSMSELLANPPSTRIPT